MQVRNIRRHFALPREEDEKTTFNEIEEGIYFRGHNLWLLVLSMAIACIGLNINSTAAVIGAMLISPLMGPIVGMAFGLSIGNRNLLRFGLTNWMLMIVVALASSTLYFLISPFHAETAQLEGFKNATVFDCFLAFFGGLAWFLGIIRKEAIKVIAGVAVSTACIPPLCTAGYGIATGNWDYFYGGFYFYLINCFFIGIGTWVLSILLGYQQYYLNKNLLKNRTTSLFISLLSVILLIPSMLLTKKKWDKEALKERSDQYISLIKDRHPELTIISYESFQKNDQKFLTVTLLNDSTSVSKERLEQHNDLVKDIHLLWKFSPNASYSATEMQKMQNQIVELRKEVDKLKKTNSK